ncbi:MAG: glycosyltransferase family 2 protein [Pleurocapsa sp. MO_226.B13]|nr:glycosyltransferase family 2 protein [Pleurocapsa sp. MO_226.B13]
MDRTYPKISIVTPSYNQGKFIESAIQSVLEQNYPNFEHIILDNCSTDRTVEILQNYPHLIWESKPDRGQSDALNQGFRLATGDIIGWLNADDLYLPECFEKTVKSFANSPESDIAYGDYRWIDEQGNIVQFRKELDFDLFILKYLHVSYIIGISTFFRRRIFEEDNFLDTSFHYSMDYEFFLRLARKRYKFVHIDSYLTDFRWHKENKSTVAYQKQIEEKKKALLRHDNFLQKTPLHIQSIAINSLELLARGKRYFIKGLRGYYFEQWPGLFHSKKR